MPVGTESYAIPIEWVREVVSTPEVAPLATAPSVVLGLFNLRGQIVPLFDTARLLGVGSVTPVVFAVVVQTPSGPAGLAASALPRRALLSAPTGSSELPGTNGTYRAEHRVAVLLDLAVLLDPERLSGREHRDVAIPVGSPSWAH